jgi:hypothetical protein
MIRDETGWIVISCTMRCGHTYCARHSVSIQHHKVLTVVYNM